MTPVWSRLLETIDAQGAAALVSVLATAGSAPREAGARMIVRPDGGFWGTVGGGALEWELIRHANAALERGSAPELRDWPLGPDLGQCCGGRVTTLVEAFGREDRDTVAAFAAMEAKGPFETVLRLASDGKVLRQPASSDAACEDKRARGRFVERFGDDRTPLLLFGAGHVGRAVVLALAPLPFRVRWIDPRADAFPSLIPANVEAVLAPEPVAEVEAAEPGSLVLVMTHSHPLDLDITAAALSRGDLAFVGLIGSRSKKARFIGRMRRAGLSDVRIAALTCPIGVHGLHGKEPAVIAASVAVQLLQVREQVHEKASRGLPDPAMRSPMRANLRLAGASS